MASFKQLLVALSIMAIFVPSTLAVEFVVGDETGWTINFDYQAWAQGKEFHVGDKLVFKYPQGAHNVLKVNGTEFQQCSAAAGTVPLTSGNDVITLATPGRKWYICGVGEHCEAGNQKLFINVLDQELSPQTSLSPSPSSSPSRSPSPTSPSQNQPSAASIVSASGFALIAVAMGVLGAFLA